MPTVAIPSLMQNLTRGQERVVVKGATLREVVENLEQAYPGIKNRLCDGDRIHPSIGVYIDGVLSREGMRQRVEENTEIHFLPAISGGI
jgi:molybdopterin synthase sulfur carrier subunit